jgi:hypothetical protein
MRNGIVLTIIGIFAAASAADPIRYDRIPADVVSYFSVDIESLLASRLAQIETSGVDTIRKTIELPEFKRGFYGSIASATMYSLGKEGNPVLLLHGSAQKFHQEVEVPNSTDTVVFEYDHQEIHYSSSCLLPGVFGAGREKNVSDIETRNQISIGIGGATASRFHGAFYTAYVGQDLIVVAMDLPSMAEALDVIDGKKPSLQKEDPHELKAQAPPGVIAVGAGLSAYWTGGNLEAGDKSNSTTRPVRVANSDFGLDLFGSFKGKARLARFELGENQQNDYADAAFTMIDSDAAGQLKNLFLGFKALVSLSQTADTPLLDPLEIEVAGNDVVLHWSMPTAKLSELLHQLSEPPAHDSSLPANVPTSQTIH